MLLQTPNYTIGRASYDQGLYLPLPPTHAECRLSDQWLLNLCSDILRFNNSVAFENMDVVRRYDCKQAVAQNPRDASSSDLSLILLLVCDKMWDHSPLNTAVTLEPAAFIPRAIELVISGYTAVCRPRVAVGSSELSFCCKTENPPGIAHDIVRDVFLSLTAAEVRGIAGSGYII